MSFYKLVRFLKTYVNLKKVETLIVICLYTASKKLCKLRYKYENLHKDVFIDRYKQLNIVEDYKVFLNKIKEFKPWIIKFNKNDIIKFKTYLSDYIVEDNY